MCKGARRWDRKGGGKELTKRVHGIKTEKKPERGTNWPLL